MDGKISTLPLLPSRLRTALDNPTSRLAKADCRTEELKTKWKVQLDSCRKECNEELQPRLLSLAKRARLAYSGGERSSQALEDNILASNQQEPENILPCEDGRAFDLKSTLPIIAYMTGVQPGRHDDAKGSDSNQARDLCRLQEYEEIEQEALIPEASLEQVASRRRMDIAQTQVQRLSRALESTHQALEAKALLAAQKREEAARRYDLLRQGEEDAIRYRVSAQAQLTDLIRERAQIDQQYVEERDSLAKGLAYLKDCRKAIEREEEAARKQVDAARLVLIAVKRERARATEAREAALEDFKAAATLVRDRIGSRVPDLPMSSQRCLSIQKEAPATATAHQESTEQDPPTPSMVESNGIHSCATLRLSLPVLDSATSVAPVLHTPPISPESTPDASFPTSTSIPSADNCHVACGDKYPSTIGSSRSVSKAEHIVVLVGDDQPYAAAMSQCATAEFATALQGITIQYLENPIGQYVRAPMPLEDMQKCIRCLLGKDKSLKTGNHARAFLGLSWSVIVSFDPDILLARGVEGIKAGSTGMASRLRMMTIIESALSNQNDDSIPEAIWERPTFFCESCRNRYPISVDSDKAVLTFEESEKLKAYEAAPSGIASVCQEHQEIKSIPRTESQAETSTVRTKRAKKRLRGRRGASSQDQVDEAQIEDQR